MIRPTDPRARVSRLFQELIEDDMHEQRVARPARQHREPVPTWVWQIAIYGASAALVVWTGVWLWS